MERYTAEQFVDKISDPAVESVEFDGGVISNNREGRFVVVKKGGVNDVIFVGTNPSTGERIIEIAGRS